MFKLELPDPHNTLETILNASVKKSNWWCEKVTNEFILNLHVSRVVQKNLLNVVFGVNVLFCSAGEEGVNDWNNTWYAILGKVLSMFLS